MQTTTGRDEEREADATTGTFLSPNAPNIPYQLFLFSRFARERTCSPPFGSERATIGRSVQNAPSPNRCSERPPGPFGQIMAAAKAAVYSARP
jgi:hypothetical protein